MLSMVSRRLAGQRFSHLACNEQSGNERKRAGNDNGGFDTQR